MCQGIAVQGLQGSGHFSHQTVAGAVRISAKTYERYENAEREPTASVLPAPADFYDISLDCLVVRAEQR